MLDWYVEKLGLRVVAKEDDHKFALLAGDDASMIGILGTDDRAQKLIPYFRTDNLDKVVVDLGAKSVTVGNVEVQHWGKQAKVTDPEGNDVYLYEESGSNSGM